jgi:beta-galactosidase
VRTYDPAYIAAVDAWWSHLLPLVQPLLVENGGPVVMVQVENEYGSFGDVLLNPSDAKYLRHLISLARQYLGSNIVLYTTDGGDLSYITRGSFPDGSVYAVGDFGPGSDPAHSFDAMKTFNPRGRAPPFCSEFYTGWLTHWGESMANTSSADVAQWMGRIFDLNGSVNLYMAHGGTNWGVFSGSNGGGASFQPHITSYDYDSPISEGGEHGYGSDGADKFSAIRSVILKYFPNDPPPPEPAPPVHIAYGPVAMTERADLFANLAVFGPSLNVSRPLPLEQYGFFYGLALLRALSVPNPSPSGAPLTLETRSVRDRAQLFINGSPVGVVYRPSERPVVVSQGPSGSTFALDVLVENMGRINYGTQMVDPKGILDGVYINGKGPYLGWQLWGIGLEYALTQKLAFAPIGSQRTGPAYFRGTFSLPSNSSGGGATYVALYGWGKGYVWLNGNLLGRYWDSMGPQHTLFAPSAWLVFGDTNEVIILELTRAADNVTIELKDGPDFHTGSQCDASAAAQAGDTVAMWTCGEQGVHLGNQQWNWTASDGRIRLVASGGQLCLQSGPANDPTSGYPSMSLAPCVAGAAPEQTFAYKAGASEFINGNGLCLDITAHRSADGSALEVYPCAGSTNQQFVLHGDGSLVSAQDGHCVTVCASSSTAHRP